MKLFVIISVLLLHQVRGDESSTGVSLASNQFANNIYKELSRSEGNLLICPISLHLALALVHEGAAGNTANELAKSLSIRGANGNSRFGYKSILSSINSNTLRIATKLYPAISFQLNENYVKEAREYFLSDIEGVDYNNPTTAARTINKYVREKTNNKIHDLISPDSLSSMTSLVIINAVHFQAQWKKPFPSAYEAFFKVTPDNKVLTKMMTQTDYFDFKEDSELDAKILKMDYDVGGFSMIFILPNKINALSEVEAKLTNMSLERVLKDLKDTKVDVTIPKFTLEQTLDLKETLQKMGIRDMFSTNADLSRMASGGNLFVSQVIQKTYINVHENGTEAAAASGILETLSAIPDNMVFNARRPFKFHLITNQKPNQVLFEGRFVHPKKIQNGDEESSVNQEEGHTPLLFEDDTSPNTQSHSVMNKNPYRPTPYAENKPVNNNQNGNNQEEIGNKRPPQYNQIKTQPGYPQSSYSDTFFPYEPQNQGLSSYQTPQNFPASQSNPGNRNPPSSQTYQSEISHQTYHQYNPSQQNYQKPTYSNTNQKSNSYQSQDRSRY